MPNCDPAPFELGLNETSYCAPAPLEVLVKVEPEEEIPAGRETLSCTPRRYWPSAGTAEM
eukprot:7384449-Prymnesium_polylepis.1